VVPSSDIDPDHFRVNGITEKDISPANDVLARQGRVFRDDPFDKILKLPHLIVRGCRRVVSALQQDN
jgi:hypothetical protein